MNITELIVELLQNGQRVELPGIGTFDSTMQAPRHDTASGTYYPTTRNIVFSEQTSGDNAIVKSIAERECVNEQVAQQMWTNYIDALTDKIQRTGEHRFGELGTLSKAGSGYAFSMADGVVIEAGGATGTTLQGVKTYDHSGSDDPFAQFDMDEPQTVETPQPEPMPAPEPEPEPEPAPEPDPEPDLKAEEEAARLAKAAELEAERKAREAKREAERKAKEAEKEAARKLKEEQRLAEEAAKEAVRQAKAAEIEATRQAKEAEKEAARQAKAAKKEAAKATALAPNTSDDKHEEKKRGKGWLWLLLLLAGGAYYFLKAKPSVATTELTSSKHFETPNTNSLTFNTDMLEYSGRDINRNTDMVCRTMADYIDNFLSGQGYSNARTAMTDMVHQYADQRLNELLGTRLAAQRFLPYDDYVYTNAEPWLRKNYAYQSRGKVQGELMDQGILDKMLNKVIDEYSIMPDNAQGAVQTEPRPAQAEAAQKAPLQKKADAEDDKPVHVYVGKNSKQGFDIVAGFYLNKATAAKMTARLHELGCDAYIIEKNEMYYVSMGSAPTRTKAEALYKHIKSWYDGDIVIKEL